MPARPLVLAALMGALALGACQPQGHQHAMERLSLGDARVAATAPHGRGDDAPPWTGANPAVATAPMRSGADHAGAPVQQASRGEPAAPAEAVDPGAAAKPDVDPDPARFLGATPAGLAAQLGKPAMVRREPPAEVWQYRTSRCVLDLFLYPDKAATRDKMDGGKADRAVVHLEARDTQAQPVPPADCLEGLLRARLTG